jgi:DNA replication protein DnaC
MTGTDDLVPVLKRLKLGPVLQTLDLRLEQAAKENLDPLEFLFRVLHDEVERRDSKNLQDRLERAGFEHDKTLEGFNWQFNPQIQKSRIVDLATCLFIERKENILFIGPAGVGKSHLAQALGHRAVRRGHDVQFLTAARLFAHLREGRGDGTYEKRLAKLVSTDVLILDDFLLTPLKADEPGDLYELIRLRYERAPLIVTSNRDDKEWTSVFGDPLLATAAVDRLLHHAHVIEIDGPSFRNQRRGRKAAPTEASA